MYNVHNLLHLADDVKLLGCLDDFSAFVFENKLGKLKKLIRKPQYPLQQILRRLHECNSIAPDITSIEPFVKSEHFSGPLIPSLLKAKQFSHVIMGLFHLSLTSGNNCVLVNGGVPVKVKNIVKHD